eukprot:PhF_6_TR26186/c0_g2_i6/m.37238
MVCSNSTSKSSVGARTRIYGIHPDWDMDSGEIDSSVQSVLRGGNGSGCMVVRTVRDIVHTCTDRYHFGTTDHPRNVQLSSFSPDCTDIDMVDSTVSKTTLTVAIHAMLS